jgi:hypothetical protein
MLTFNRQGAAVGGRPVSTLAPELSQMLSLCTTVSPVSSTESL